MFTLLVLSFLPSAPGATHTGTVGHLERTPEGLSTGEWGSIRAAHESWNREVVATPEGYRARSRAQQWLCTFDGHGVTIAPEGGAWTWGIELERWGFAGALRKIEGRTAGCAEGERLGYGWDSRLTEWYANVPSGLEHGYTVHRRPDGDGPLVFELIVRGGLKACIDADGRSARFVGGSGASVLIYRGLAVRDAADRELDARLTAREGGLRIEVDEGGAQYPITIDPMVQQAYLKASNSDADDWFGASVSVSGNTAVVGAPNEDSSATGVNGNQADNSATNAGAAYVFVRNGTTWTQEAYLKASNTDGVDHFGNSVSVSGDTVVVGAPNEDSSGTGVNGNQADNSATNAGAAYVFVRNGTAWTQEAYLKASNTDAADWFGCSVSLSGDTVVVGADLEDSNATGVDGNQADNSALQAGAAYVFVRSGTSWTQGAYLKASNTDGNDWFGVSVAVSGGTVVVGAWNEDSSATGVNGNQADFSATNSGAAYVFVRNGTAWTQEAYLKASNTDGVDFFGTSVSISGDTVVVGAYGESSNATGVNGNQADNSALQAGAAYVFVRNGTTWTQEAYLKASNTGVRDWFGWSVSVSGDTVAVGAVYEDSNATGVNGNQADNSAEGAGAAYVFVRSGTIWTQEAYLKASNTDADDWFGVSVAVSGDTVVVGAPNEDSSATGVNGNQGDNSATNAGAAYVFLLPPGGPEAGPFCFGDGGTGACPCNNAGSAGHGCANSQNAAGALLTTSGTTSPDTLMMTSSGELPTSLSILLQGDTDMANPVVFGDGLRCVGGVLMRLFQASAPGGVASFPPVGAPSISARSAALGDPIAPGSTRSYQVYYRDPDLNFCAAPPGNTYNVSNAQRVIW